MLSYAFGEARVRPACHEFGPGNVMLLCPADEDYPEGRIFLVTGMGLNEDGVRVVKAVDLHSSTVKQYGDFCLNESEEFPEPVDDIKTQRRLLNLPVTIAGGDPCNEPYILTESIDDSLPPMVTLGGLGFHSGFDQFTHFCRHEKTVFRAFFGIETFLYEEIRSNLLRGNMIVAPTDKKMIFGLKKDRDNALLYAFGYPDIMGLNIPLHDERLALN